MEIFCKAIEEVEITQVIVTYHDRLTRFCFNYLERYFISQIVSIACIQQNKTLSIQVELVNDMIANITSFLVGFMVLEVIKIPVSGRKRRKQRRLKILTKGK